MYYINVALLCLLADIPYGAYEEHLCTDISLLSGIVLQGLNFTQGRSVWNQSSVPMPELEHDLDCTDIASINKGVPSINQRVIDLQ